MHKTMQMEEFSRAYVKAIIARAGYVPYRPEVDDDSIDIGVAGSDRRRARLELQLKCTSAEIDPKQDTFPFDLPVKNYDDLRADSIVPRLLVVVCVPRDVSQWTNQTERELCLRHCGYWYSLANFADTNNENTVRCQIPKDNLFSVKFLQDAMQRIADGGQL